MGSCPKGHARPHTGDNLQLLQESILASLSSVTRSAHKSPKNMHLVTFTLCLRQLPGSAVSSKLLSSLRLPNGSNLHRKGFPEARAHIWGVVKHTAPYWTLVAF